MINPLLTLGDALPAFDQITAAHVEPALSVLNAQVLAGLDAFEQERGGSTPAAPTWDSVLTRLHELTEPLRLAWGVVGHLVSVCDTPELRAAHQAMQSQVVTTWVRLGQSRAIYEALTALRDGPVWAELDATQRRIVTNEIRDMDLSGVGLTGAAKERYQAISLELNELATRFSHHLLDATKAFALDLTATEDLAGLPQTLLAQAAAAAKAVGLEVGARAGAGEGAIGPWRITLDAPSYVPFMEHSQRADLRERLYRAMITRAAAGPHDNQPVMVRILALRSEMAALLGKGSHAEISLATKMAGSVAAVDALLSQLRVAAKPKAAAELAELTAFARTTSGSHSLVLNLWDVAFWAERLREARYSYTDEELRPYFSLPRVLDGLFALTHRLFGVRVTAIDGRTSVWDPAVQVFRISDADGQDRALFYLDPYSRPANKRGGAWMNSYRDRRLRSGTDSDLKKRNEVRIPVAYLICNQTPPVGAAPSLMTFREVETLFHEFGHGLQHMLTTVDHPQVAGINGVEWDAVELPSQFMENWCYDAPTIRQLAHHWQTGEALPAALFERICAARIYRAGSATLRQVYLSTLDLELHHRMRADESPQAVQKRIAAENSVLPPLPEDRFLCSFSHIFAGGYAAGYYSYKWAEVLSADAFAAFTEAAPEAASAIGQRFRATVLAQGGAQHPLEVFRAFRGREPQVGPLLVQTGLA